MIHKHCFEIEILTIIVVDGASVSPLEHALVLLHADENANWSTRRELVDEGVCLNQNISKHTVCFSNSASVFRSFK